MVRRTILLGGARHGFTAEKLLRNLQDAEYYPDIATLMNEILSRYDQSPSQALADLWATPALRLPPVPLGEEEDNNRAWLYLYRHHPAALLHALPDVEFLATVELAAAEQTWSARTRAPMWFGFIDGVMRINGLPYRVANGYRFDWVGEEFTHSHSIQPALDALRDPRLRGSDDEFREALHKRASGSRKDLEDAIDEAAKAVESALKALYGAHDLRLPKRHQATPLFDGLVRAKILPGYVDHVVLAPSGPRNNMASHGQGEAVRIVPVELADASIAAAATAITLLSRYLPVATDTDEASASPFADAVEEV